MDKKSYFEVTAVVSRWLTAGLLMVVAATFLRQWGGTFPPTGAPVGGTVGKALTTLACSGAGNAVGSVLLGAGMLLLMEPLRRGMRRSGDRFWLAVALWEVLVGVSALVSATPGQAGVYSYAHTPTAWESFRETFLLNEQILSGCLQVVVACALIVRYRGRIRLYGVSELVCPLLLGAGVWLFSQWSLSPEASPHAVLLGYFVMRAVLAIVPVALLRLSMSTRIEVQPAGKDGDVAPL